MANCSAGGGAGSFVALAVIRACSRFEMGLDVRGALGTAIIGVGGCSGSALSCCRCSGGQLDGGGFGCSCSAVGSGPRLA